MTGTRQSISSVVQGLTTNADKIRALARAGYLRTEIRDFLDIRYQQVRKVLEDAGIKDGLSRSVEVDRSPIVIEEKPVVPVPSAFLLKGGFWRLGEWMSVSAEEFSLSTQAPKDPGVYAFLVDDVVKYVGLTLTGLRTRMGHYRLGYERHRTSRRVKGLILEALAKQRKVEILIATPEALEWNGLPVNGAAGLEAGLIRMIRPEWNMLGSRKRR